MRRRLLIGVVAALVAVASSFAVGPRPLELPDQTTGDDELAERVRGSFGPRPGFRAATFALVEDGSVDLAGIGTAGDADHPVDPRSSSFEIGSLTKPLTGMLMASMTPDPVLPGTDVGSVVGPDILGDSALGDVTLAQPAHHRSGLPRLPLSPAIVAGSFASRLGAHDPYPDWSASRLLREAADTSAGEKKFAYSNLGGAVAGHTLAIAADEKYPTLMQDRIFGPIGMDHTIVATSWEDLPDGRVTGSDSQGRTQSPWVSPGFAPAGIGTWSTAEDLGILLASILDGNAPGLEATRPEVSIDSEGAYAIGKFWLTSEHNGQTITWHNGGTDGFRSWMGFDRDAGTGVAILSAGHRDLEDLGLYLLGAGEAPDDQGWALPGWLGIGVVILLTLGVWRIWRAALRARQGKGTDLVGVAGLGIESLIILTIGWVLGPWTTLPWTVWSAIAAATLVGLGGLIWWNRDAKWFHGSKWRALNTVVNLGLAAVVVVLIL